MRGRNLFIALVLLAALLPAASAQGALETPWADLLESDAATAYRAIWTLAKSPRESVAWIGDKLAPAKAPDPKVVDEFIQDLSSETFALREKATKELTKLGDLAEPALRKALAAKPTTLEAKQRLERILERLEGPIVVPEQLQAIRAIEALELIGDDAKALLGRYASGAPGALLTREAAQALERLATPKPKSPAVNATRTDLFGDPLPLGAAARFGTVRFRREYLNTTTREGMAFLPGDKAIVTYPFTTTGLPLSRDHGIQIWETATGRLLRTLDTDPLGISACAVTTDGKMIAVALNQRPTNTQRPSEIRVYQLPSGELAHSFTYKSGGITHNLALAPDGKTLFSLRSGAMGRPDSFLQIEEIATGKVIAKKEYPSSLYAKMVLSGDGKYLAASTNYKDVLLWDWHGPDQRTSTLSSQTKVAGSTAVGGMEFSPDGKWLAMVDGAGTLSLFEIPSGRLHLAQESIVKSATYSNPTFTSDSKTLAWATREKAANIQIVLLDIATGTRKRVIDNVATIYSHLAFSGDGKTLAVNALQRSSLALQIWDLTANANKNSDSGHRSEPQQLIMSAKGILAAADVTEIHLWDSVTFRPLRKIPYAGTLHSLALAPDARLAAWISNVGPIHVIDTQTDSEVFLLNRHGTATSKTAVAFASAGLSLYTVAGDFTLRRWDMHTGALTFERALRPSGITVPEDAKKLASFATSSGLHPVFSPGARTLLLGLGEKYFLFDSTTGKEISQFNLDARSSASKLVISPDGKYLLSRANGTSVAGAPPQSPVALTELATGRTNRRWQVPGLAAGPIAFSPDGRMFATTGDEAQKTIALYEISSGKLRGTISGPAKVTSLTFFPDGRFLATGHADSTILSWDLAVAVK